MLRQRKSVILVLNVTSRQILWVTCLMVSVLQPHHNYVTQSMWPCRGSPSKCHFSKPPSCVTHNRLQLMGGKEKGDLQTQAWIKTAECTKVEKGLWKTKNNDIHDEEDSCMFAPLLHITVVVSNRRISVTVHRSSQWVWKHFFGFSNHWSCLRCKQNIELISPRRFSKSTWNLR